MRVHSNRSGQVGVFSATRVLAAAAPLVAIAVVALAVPSMSASAATPTNSLVVTGALSGTLKIGPTSSCSGTTGYASLSSFATTLSTKKYSKWSITITLAKPGAAAKKFNSSTATFVLQSGLNGWVATKGTMTLASHSGSVNLTLGAHEGTASGTVHIKGSWNCTG